MHPFRQAVEAHDLDAIPDLLAEDVTFLSPVAFQPYRGRALVAAILRGADRAFEDFHYIRETTSSCSRHESAIGRSTVPISCTTTTTA
jgi:ketosteroid isomerase-like protein